MTPAIPVFTAVAVATLLGPWQAAEAGRACEHKPLDARGFQQGLELAERVRQHLDTSGAQVVVLARRGQDLDRYRLRYSHLGWAYKETGGAWRVVHKLNHCGTDRAALYRHGLGEFFLEDLHAYEAGVVIPRPDVQAKLLAVLGDNPRVQALHTPAYNMLAYPWAQRYQQSNQWAIETLALAMEPQAHSRRQAQAWLQFQGYQPTVLRLGAMTRLGARVTAANIAFDDHPNDKRFADRIETVTVDSVFAWLERSGLGGAAQHLR
jgi:hypothetical protein